MIGRGLATAVAAVGAAAAGIGAQAAESRVGALALAIGAGIARSLMLRGAALRILGSLLVALGVAAAVWAVQLGQWVPAIGFAVAALASVGFVVWGPRWTKRHRSEADRPVDLWAAMDEGDDPTDEQGVHQSSPSR